MKPLIIILILTFCYSCSSDKKETTKTEKYSIDASIIPDVMKYTRNYDGDLQGQLRIIMYNNDTVVADNYTEGQMTPYSISIFENKDTITIVGWVAAFQTAGMGYMIKISENGYEVFYGIDTGMSGNYKLNPGDSAYSQSIWVPAIKSKLVLSLKPEPGIHPLHGFVDFETQDFYEKNTKNEKVEDSLDKYKVRMSAYFITEREQPTQQ